MHNVLSNMSPKHLAVHSPPGLAGSLYTHLCFMSYTNEYFPDGWDIFTDRALPYVMSERVSVDVDTREDIDRITEMPSSQP